MNREAVIDLTLHDGFVIPAGQTVAFSQLAINTDPNMYPDPHTFHGFRFAELRERPENHNKYQFVTTGPDAMAFGHGVHACPGRFFASNEIKIVIAGIIMRYDIAFGANGGSGPRPKNVDHGSSIVPDMSHKVYFKKRGM